MSEPVEALRRWTDPAYWRRCEDKGASPEQVAQSARLVIADLLARLISEEDHVEVLKARLAEVETRAEMWRNTHATELREVELLRADRDRCYRMIDRLVDAGVERWHTVANDEPSLSSWLELTDAEYGAWVEGQAPKLIARAALDPEQQP